MTSEKRAQKSILITCYYPDLCSASDWMKQFSALVRFLSRYFEREPPGGGGGREGEVLPYMGYIGMCRCEGYGFGQFTL